MKKTQVVSGIKGALACTVEIKLNAGIETKEFHNPSTHDEEKKAVPYHSVTGYIDNTLELQEKMFNESQLLDLGDRMMENLVKKAKARLEQTADEKFKQLAAERGYE